MLVCFSPYSVINQPSDNTFVGFSSLNILYFYFVMVDYVLFITLSYHSSRLLNAGFWGLAIIISASLTATEQNYIALANYITCFDISNKC